MNLSHQRLVAAILTLTEPYRRGCDITTHGSMRTCVRMLIRDSQSHENNRDFAPELEENVLRA